MIWISVLNRFSYNKDNTNINIFFAYQQNLKIWNDIKLTILDKKSITIIKVTFHIFSFFASSTFRTECTIPYFKLVFIVNHSVFILQTKLSACVERLHEMHYPV